MQQKMSVDPGTTTKKSHSALELPSVESMQKYMLERITDAEGAPRRGRRRVEEMRRPRLDAGIRAGTSGRRRNRVSTRRRRLDAADRCTGAEATPRRGNTRRSALRTWRPRLDAVGSGRGKKTGGRPVIARKPRTEKWGKPR